MSGIKYLLDTNIILGIVKANPDVVVKIKGLNLKDCAYSSVTRMELLGFPDITEHEIKVISALLNKMNNIAIDFAIEDETIKLKQQHRIKLPDAIILATSLNREIKLYTMDKSLANKA